jgi:hypothetical protein
MTEVRKVIRVDAEKIQMLVDRLDPAMSPDDIKILKTDFQRLVRPKSRGKKIKRIRSLKAILETGPRDKAEAIRWINAKLRQRGRHLSEPEKRRFLTPLIVDAKRMVPGLKLTEEYFMRKHQRRDTDT